MKILLIKPPMTLLEDFNGIASLSFPMGLGYISAMLEKNGHDVKLIDAALENWKKISYRYDGVKYVGLDWDDITELVKREKPDVVGISILTVDAINALKVADAVKRADKNILVVAGGPHVCVRPDQTIADPNVDVIGIGEGEYTMLELVVELEKGDGDLRNVAGIWFKDNGEVVKNPAREPIHDLDALPFPDRSILKKYFGAIKYFQSSRDLYANSSSIITSRGCPFSCVFCSIRLSMGRKYRIRSPENVIDEIEILVNEFDVKHIYFEDDNLTLDKERMGKICDLIIEKGLNRKISWNTPNGVRADTLDRDLLVKMKESGCIGIRIAPESGSQYVVTNIIKKGIKLGSVVDVAKICKEIGLSCEAFFVIGMPGETIEQIKQTVGFANMLIDKYDVNPLCSTALPYYGTEMYELAKRKGYLTKSDGRDLEVAILNNWGIIKTEEFSPEQLVDIRQGLRTGKQVSMIKSLIKSRPVGALRFFSVRYKFILSYMKKYFL